VPATSEAPVESAAPQLGPIGLSFPPVQPAEYQALQSLRDDLRLMRDQLEQARRDAAFDREADRLASRLWEVEAAMATRAATDAETVQAWTRTALVIAALVVGIGLILMLATSWLQWRALARIVAGASQTRLLSPPPTPPLEALTITPSAAAERSNFRLSNALLQLEQRLADLERSTPGNGKAIIVRQESPPKPNVTKKLNGASQERNEMDETLEILLARGQAFLNAERLEEAILTFEQVLATVPTHAEALLKRGVALERSGRTDEAISSYDQAIAADPGFTAAYLHKGGLFNRLERYSEALECYEKALRLKERRSGK
jgi:cytochrome c-type biogenesis protein CcmH/NrfG